MATRYTYICDQSGSWWEQCGIGDGEDLYALGNKEEYVGGGSYSGGEGGCVSNSCWEAAVTVTVGDMSIQEAGMIGVSDGFERLQQHSVKNIWKFKI